MRRMSWTGGLLAAALATSGCQPVAATCEQGASPETYFDYCNDPNPGQECAVDGLDSTVNAGTCLDGLILRAGVDFDTWEEDGGSCADPLTVTTREGDTYQIAVEPDDPDGPENRCFYFWHCNDGVASNRTEVCHHTGPTVGLRPGAAGKDPWTDCAEALQHGVDGDGCNTSFYCTGQRELPEGSWAPASDTLFVQCDQGTLRIYPFETALAGEL